VARPSAGAGLERRWKRSCAEPTATDIAVDAKGRELDKDTQEALIPETERLVPATPGNNLVLSIDEKLQRAADVAFLAGPERWWR